MKVRARKKVDATFNMSSMTDIVFLLLIFFIVLSTLVTPPGVPVELPKVDNKDKISDPPRLAVTIDIDRNYFLDNTPMSYEALLNELRSRISPNSKQPAVKLVADGNIPLEMGVELFADIKKIGYEKVVIATQPKQN